MKTKQICAMALAALTFIGFSACKPTTDPEQELKLSETSVSMKVGETHTLTANITVDAWASTDATIASVADGVVTALKEGSAIITATAGSQTKTCIVAVTKDGQQGGDDSGSKTVKGSQIWPIILDATTAATVSSKMVADFRVDDTNSFLYVWASGETYTAGDGTGLNFFGNTEGYVSLTVAAPAGWSGAGWFIGANVAPEAEKLRAAIVASPDDYYLHMAMKATTTGNHQFYTFASATTSFAIGTGTIETGAVVGDFTRDGSWYEFDIPMSQFATALASITFKAAGDNIFCSLSGGQVGSQLNLDAVYFYKK